MNGYPTAQTGTINEEATLAMLVAYCDQLEAAVNEIGEAWTIFVHGGLITPPTNSSEQPPVSDRLLYSRDSLHAQIDRLRSLASDITRRGGK
jgi:hypothetical protein